MTHSTWRSSWSRQCSSTSPILTKSLAQWNIAINFYRPRALGWFILFLSMRVCQRVRCNLCVCVCVCATVPLPLSVCRVCVCVCLSTYERNIHGRSGHKLCVCSVSTFMERYTQSAGHQTDREISRSKRANGALGKQFPTHHTRPKCHTCYLNIYYIGDRSTSRVTGDVPSQPHLDLPRLLKPSLLQICILYYIIVYYIIYIYIYIM